MKDIDLTQFTALKVGVSSVTWPAGTNSPVVSSLTVCIGSTGTWVYTFLISTSQSSVTFRISQALIGLALYVGTTLVTWRTLAPSSMNIDCTKSFDTALFKWTWILAFSLDASLT